MRTMSLSLARFNMSYQRLRDLVSGHEEPITLMSGRGKDKKPVAVLISHERWEAVTKALDGIAEEIRRTP